MPLAALTKGLRKALVSASQAPHLLWFLPEMSPNTPCVEGRGPKAAAFRGGFLGRDWFLRALPSRWLHRLMGEEVSQLEEAGTLKNVLEDYDI